MYIIAGKFKKNRLHVPKGDHIRPTTSKLREAFFNICQCEIEGAHFLDLFAGSGAMGFEALSRGASHVTFVEKNSCCLRSIKKNIEELEMSSQTSVYPMDAIKAVSLMHRESKQFTLIYADPPYGQNLGSLLLSHLDVYPLIAKGGSIFIEDTTASESPLQSLKLHHARKAGCASLFEFRQIIDV
jgi:16S rRNA (guanine966-N2)-methyltransferase